MWIDCPIVSKDSLNTVGKYADGYLFDIDGTLWDATESSYHSWCKTIKEEYPSVLLPSQSDFASIMGYDENQTISFFEKKFCDKSSEIVRKCLDKEALFIMENGAYIYPKMVETIEFLSKRAPIYIVSNCTRTYLTSFLHYTSLHDFVYDCCCENFPFSSKVDNIHYIITKYKLNYPVYIGDSQPDYDAAIANGCVFIYASYGFGKAHMAPIIIKKIGDLFNLYA